MKVLISSRSFGKIDSSAIENLRKAGLDPVMNPSGKTLNEEEIIRLIDKDTVGIIAGTEKITKKILEAGSSIKVIARYGIGMDNIDLVTAENLGIIVKNTPEAPTQAVAELSLALILNLMRKICLVNHDIRENKWAPPVGNLLTGKTLGFIGLGRIGKRVCQLVKAFNVRILSYEINPDKAFLKENKIESVSLQKLLKESDIISLHVPVTKETRNMIGKEQFALMKPNALFINTARGELVDETALIDALDKKIIGGAAIDAFVVEPYQGELKNYENVILTPHIGSLTEESRKRMEQETVENLISSLKRES